MQFIFDNLIASIVTGIVLFMLIGTQLATQRANIDANLHYMSRVQTNSLIETIERDFPNIGAGRDATVEPMITAYDWSASEPYFEFWSITGSDEDATPELIRYEVTPSESSLCEQADTPCLKVERFVNANSSGTSVETLTEFDIEVFPDTGDLRDVREIRVRLAALSAAGDKGLVGRTVWETSFRPYSLGLQP